MKNENKKDSSNVSTISKNETIQEVKNRFTSSNIDLFYLKDKIEYDKQYKQNLFNNLMLVNALYIARLNNLINDFDFQEETAEGVQYNEYYYFLRDILENKNMKIANYWIKSNGLETAENTFTVFSYKFQKTDNGGYLVDFNGVKCLCALTQIAILETTKENKLKVKKILTRDLQVK